MFPGSSSAVAVEPVSLCVRHCRDCREGRASRGRARDVDVPVPQIQEQSVEVVKEILHKIDFEKLMDEDVDEMILETDVDGVNQHFKDPGTSRSQVQWVTAWCFTRRRLDREVEQPKIKTVVKCMEYGDFHSHEWLVCVLKLATSELS